MTTLNPRDIDWSRIAATAKADLGDEAIERFSDRFRTIVMITTEALRPGDAAGPRFGEPAVGRVSQ